MTRILLALLLLTTAALAGNTDIIKSPACGAGVIVVQPEPDIRFIGVPINYFKALAEMKTRCKMPGRQRMSDGKCWKPATWLKVMQ